MLNSSRVHLDRLVGSFARDCPDGCRVLDAGAGAAPYRRHFAHTVYETADHHASDRSGNRRLSHVCDLTAIPVADARFDRLICTQVLEHLPNPKAALREMARVLRPDGVALFTMPLFYEEHEAPRDYFRFTRYGLHETFRDTGFADIEIDWLEGYFGTVAYQMRTAAAYLPVRGGTHAPGLVARAQIAAIKLFAARAARLLARLDVAHRVTDRGFPINYVVRAKARPR